MLSLPESSRRPSGGNAARARNERACGALNVMRNAVRTRSVPAEAERVAGRIEVYAERVARNLARLHQMLRCSECEHFGLDRVDIVDGHVEVELLRPLTARPRRRREVVSLLKRHSQPIDGEYDPVLLGESDLSTNDTSVKLGK
jgi:hypothetical protein